jgi:hypothetical protein
MKSGGAGATDAERGAGTGSLASVRRWIIRADAPTTDAGGWGIWQWFFLAFGAIAAGMIFMGRSFYFGTPLYETADLAANSLQILRAIHVQEIHGNYSRFGFHHPGPAFFYIYAAGEVAFFDLLHLVPAPHNGHLLAGALLQSAFLAAAIAVLARYAAPNRGLFVTAAIAAALVHFQLAGDLETSIWPPNQLLVPFACFLVVAIAVACGRMGLVPLLVICGGFLVHGHVAQPLFVLPIGGFALGLGFWTRYRQDALPVFGLIRRHLKSLALAFVILVIFLVPLAIDAVHGSNSNLATIAAYLTKPRAATDTHSITQVLGYALAFLSYPSGPPLFNFDRSQFVSFEAHNLGGLAVSLLALVVLPIALLLTSRARRARVDSAGVNRWSGSRFFVVYYGFMALAAFLTLIWTYTQKGPLYPFNSYFEYGLMFVAAMPPLVVVCRRWPIKGSRATTAVVGILALCLTLSTAFPLPSQEDSNGLQLNTSIQAVVAARTSSGPVLIDFAQDDWVQATGAVLALERDHVTWYVKPLFNGWAGNVLGNDHVYTGPTGSAPAPELWFLTKPDPNHQGQIVLTPELAIYPRPPSLADYSQGH